MTSLTPADLIAFEQEIAALYDAGKIRAPVHLDGGNEADLIRVFETIDRQDWVLGSWRMHGKCLLHGVPPEKLKAEILAGRSISLCFPEHRILSSAIVGGVLPIALGIAWAIKRGGERNRVYVFSGDMTARTGTFHECVNYAYGHDLPIRFIVENNRKSVCSDTEETWGVAPWTHGKVETYEYHLHWPHAGAGRRVEF